MTLRLDYSNMMISPGGIDPEAWSSANSQFNEAKRGFEQLRSSGYCPTGAMPVRADSIEIWFASSVVPIDRSSSIFAF